PGEEDTPPDGRRSMQDDASEQSRGRGSQCANCDHGPLEGPEHLPAPGVEGQCSAGEEHGGDPRDDAGGLMHGAMMVAGPESVGASQLWVRMKSSTRRQASADSSANSACLRSKKECGAPG